MKVFEVQLLNKKFRSLFWCLCLKINIRRSYQSSSNNNPDNFGRFSCKETGSICSITNNWCISKFMSGIFCLYWHGFDWSKCKNFCNLSTRRSFHWTSAWNIHYWNMSDGTFYLRCQWCEKFIKTNFQPRKVWKSMIKCFPKQRSLERPQIDHYQVFLVVLSLA